MMSSFVLCPCLALFPFLALCLANAAEAVEVLSASYLLPQVASSSQERTAFATAIFVGMFFGGLVGGLADSIGRHAMLRSALGVATLAMLASAFAPSLGILIACRLISGMGVGMCTPPLFSLAVELAPAGRKGQAVALVVSFWMVGAIAVAGAAFAVFGTDQPDASEDATLPSMWGWSANWRRFAVACAAPPALATCMCAVFVRDAPSPTSDGSDIAIGSPPTIDLTSQPAAPSATARGPALEGSNPRGACGGAAHAYCAGVRELLRGRSRATLLALALAWFGLNFGYYGLATWVTVLIGSSSPTLASSQYAIALLYAGANLPGNLASIMLVERVGRRRLLVGAMLLSAGCTLALAFVEAQNSAEPQHADAAAVVGLAVAFNACATAGWNSLDSLSAESFHPSVRATAFGVLTCVGRLASIAAQLVNGSLARSVPQLLAVTGTLMLLGCAGAACLHEPSSLMSSGDRRQLIDSNPHRSRTYGTC